MTVHIMKEGLRSLWTAPDAWEWRRRWRQWHAHAAESGIPALMHFASVLKPYWRGILARVRWPVHTGQLEGINNKIKVIKRIDRKSTRLNSSHVRISYAVFCLKKKKKK